jgi:hypothetical protein
MNTVFLPVACFFLQYVQPELCSLHVYECDCIVDARISQRLAVSMEDLLILQGICLLLKYLSQFSDVNVKQYQCFSSEDQMAV